MMLQILNITFVEKNPYSLPRTPNKTKPNFSIPHFTLRKHTLTHTLSLFSLSQPSKCPVPPGENGPPFSNMSTRPTRVGHVWTTLGQFWDRPATNEPHNRTRKAIKAINSLLFENSGPGRRVTQRSTMGGPNEMTTTTTTMMNSTIMTTMTTTTREIGVAT